MPVQCLNTRDRGPGQIPVSPLVVDKTTLSITSLTQDLPAIVLMVLCKGFIQFGEVICLCTCIYLYLHAYLVCTDVQHNFTLLLPSYYHHW